jgi:hypothetical protein
MQNRYEAAELTLVGQAAKVVMGFCSGGDDFPQKLAADFEFEHD